MVGTICCRRSERSILISCSFYSITYGRPRCIRDDEARVHMVQNLDDTTARHPIFNSFELVHGSSRVITIFSYQIYKFELYKIASRIMAELCSHDSLSFLSVAEKIDALDKELVSWYGHLPHELQHGSDKSEEFHINTSDTRIVRIFRLQALTLQLAYDNIRILLHRPLLQVPLALEHDKRPLTLSLPTSSTPSKSKTNQTFRENSVSAISRAKCREAALRTSQICESIVKVANLTHAGSYVDIQMFTAGVVLSIVALCEPLSVTAHEAKVAIARIARISDNVENKALLSVQSGHIIQELMRLILKKEMSSMFSKAGKQDLHDTTFWKVPQEQPTVFDNTCSAQSDKVAQTIDSRGVAGHGDGGPLLCSGSSGSLEHQPNTLEQSVLHEEVDCNEPLSSLRSCKSFR